MISDICETVSPAPAPRYNTFIPGFIPVSSIPPEKQITKFISRGGEGSRGAEGEGREGRRGGKDGGGGAGWRLFTYYSSTKLGSKWIPNSVLHCLTIFLNCS